MPDVSTVLRWARDDEQFRKQYAHARELLLEVYADELIDIADDGRNDFTDRLTRSGEVKRIFNRESFERSRLRFDARRWVLSKLLPKKYGNRVGIDASGGEGEPIGLTVEARNAIIDNILRQVEPKPDNERTKPDEAREHR